MASFVEQATLKVNDQSSAQINKINAALKQLFATARSLRSVKIDIRVNAAGVSKAVADLNRLKAATQGLRSTSINLRVNTSGLSQANRQIQQLRAAAARPVTVSTQPARGAAAGRAAAAAAARPPGAVPVVPPGGVGGRRQGYGAAAARGFTQGSGLGSIIGSTSAASAGLYAVGAAAHTAGNALKSIATNAQTRDRTALQSSVLASEKQRKIIAEQGGPPPGGGPELMTQDQRTRFTNSLLGDVQGTEEERARAAVNITKQLERDYLPRALAAAPDKTPAEAMEGLRKVVQAMNLASTDMANAAGITKDGARVFEGIQKAMAADPDLSPQLIKTAMANAKTAGYSLSSDAIAQMLFNVGQRGQRAANEQFRAMAAASGTVDVKVLNNSLEKMGLLLDPQRNKKGNVIAGTGTPKQAALLQEDPAVWFNQNFKPIMDKAIGENATAAEQVAFINKQFAGMSSAGKQGIADLVLGFKQSRTQLEQANLGLKQNTDLTKSWSAQLEGVKTQWTNAAAGLGDMIAKSVDLSGIFGSLSDVIKANPMLAGAVGVAAPAVAAASPAIALTASAFALKGSAAALTAAAGRLSLAGVVGGAAGAAGGVLGGAAVGAAGGGIAGLLQRLPLLLRTTIVGAMAYALYRTLKPTPAGGESNLPELEKQNKALQDNYKAQIALQGAQQEKAALEQRIKEGGLSPQALAFAETALARVNAELAGLQAKADAAAKAVEAQGKAMEIAANAAKVVSDSFDALGIPRAQEPVPRPFPQPKAAPPTPEEKERLKYLEEQRRQAERERRQKEATDKKEADERKQRDKERGDPSDIWKNLPPEWKKPPPIYPDGKPPEIPMPKADPRKVGPPLDITATNPIPVTVTEPPEPKTPQQRIDEGFGAVPEPKPMPQPEITIGPISEAVSSGIAAGAPALSTAMSTALTELSSTFTSSISAAAAPIETAGANLGSAMQSGASSITTAGSSLAAAGETAASTIRSGAEGAGSAYGAAAAAKISAAVANVTISVQHSGSVGGAGGSDTGTSTAGKQ